MRARISDCFVPFSVQIFEMKSIQHQNKFLFLYVKNIKYKLKAKVVKVLLLEIGLLLVEHAHRIEAMKLDEYIRRE